MDIAKIIATTLEIGSGLPAYKALFDQVVSLFDGDTETQEKLQLAYTNAMAMSDAAHAAATDAKRITLEIRGAAATDAIGL